MRRTGQSRTDLTAGLHRPQVVPYIAAWSAEEVPWRESLVQTRRGLRYADETLHDRDRHGALWLRWRVAQGLGKPQFALVHAPRQRRAMRKGVCQVLNTPADRNELGWLFLLPNDGKNGDPEGEHTAHPPVSLRGARIAVALCPRMHDAIAVRAQEVVPVGVWGSRFREGQFGPVCIGEGPVLFNTPALQWCLAEQLLVELRGCTIVDRDAELSRPTPGSRAKARR